MLAHLGSRIAKHLGHAVIGVECACLAVNEPDALVGGLDDCAIKFLRSAQGLFLLLAPGDVGHKHDAATHLTLLIAIRNVVDMHVASASISFRGACLELHLLIAQRSFQVRAHLFVVQASENL